MQLEIIAREMRALTEELVGRASVNETPGERAIAEFIAARLTREGVQVRLEELAGDPHHRLNVFGILKGTSPRTLLLLSHYDTVDVEDYGMLKPFAFSPERFKQVLLARLADSASLDPALRRDLLEERESGSERWLLGRGASDMKSGVAAGMVVLQTLAAEAQENALDGNIIFMALPDEENQSAGVLQAVETLHQLATTEGLQYIGAINLDYISDPPIPQSLGQPFIYDGTVGKLLLSLYVRGVTGHAGDPLSVVDPNLALAEILQAIHADDELLELDTEWIVPPVVLHQGDLKAHYDTQTPLEAVAQVNFILRKRAPNQIFDRMLQLVREAFQRSWKRAESRRAKWRAAESSLNQSFAEPIVLSFGELMDRAGANTHELEKLRHSFPESDSTIIAANLRVVQALWMLAGIPGPGAVVYVDLPFYPAIQSNVEGDFDQAAQTVGDKFGVPVKPYYPYITDASYVGAFDPAIVSSMIEQCPVIKAVGVNDNLMRAHPGTRIVNLPQLGLPVFTLGPFGRGAHTYAERVDMLYSFQKLPAMLYDIIHLTLSQEL